MRNSEITYFSGFIVFKIPRGERERGSALLALTLSRRRRKTLRVCRPLLTGNLLTVDGGLAAPAPGACPAELPGIAMPGKD